ncbi:MAG: hypothetical protein JSU86_05435, partial [Phycisphaerales bacterium]
LRTVSSGALGPTALEQAESLEQLRWLEHGLPIGVVIVEHAFVGIDTPEDYAAFVQRTSGKPLMSNGAESRTAQSYGKLQDRAG